MSERYTVRQGDCIDSIALRYGFFPDTLWNHGENAELKRKRKYGNVLEPGDEVFIPDLTVKYEDKATEAKHRFKRRGVPAVLRLVFKRPVEQDDDSSEPTGGRCEESVYEDSDPEEYEPEFEPLSDAPYVLVVDGNETTGTADGDGMVELSIPGDASSGKITFHQGTEDEISFDLGLGQLDPVTATKGQAQRLHNLGYQCPPDIETPDDVLKAALRRLQSENGLDETGEADQTTQDKLTELHGS